ncbi:hypothetical protein G6F57_012397 [Rhizopus arrhizus]|uniref:Uncharacterized protein n=1 Tax=Rhizopus oryzae TaxID=64495 RepID=A0A9P7BN58_RHIOR|nr:hypothetical protein G6F23_009935 [Rhizopus arrhizus]KAG1402065.1 hypothetical protein G6F58_010633 [Rhizopus delemar]KAG0763273.1 hypothetical protein G6F24_006156 [Rhizopus arrhizus]KAG0779837.1 hypothetical protein G6F22_010415 [Rhizopus arrhizus]KAG0781294.1 hypothetical protein G6F21_011716 [Rhizopus arrhizus]
MLQEYPTQVQPRSSSTRDTQEEDVDSSNKVDAEASRILIDLANQDTSLHNFVGSESLKYKGDVGINHQRLQPDPIMLLAAAAAVIDDDEGRYNGRPYKRREIKLQSRRHSVTKRKSSIDLYRRHPNQRQPSTDTWMPARTITPEDEEMELKEDESQHTFSWQYLSMKQNPRIKRNAMHAYITYMIYTDMANEQRIKNNSSSNENVYKQDNHQSNWYMQSYRLPPSPRQQHDSPLPPSELPANHIIGRPLTEFLFENNHRPSSSPPILPPPNNNTRAF